MASSSQARLALFYAAYFGTVGILLPFWPLWLAHRGLDASAIGSVLSAWFWVKLFGNPIASHIADARGSRRLFMVSLAVLTVAGFALFALAESLWHFVLLAFLTGGFFAALAPLGESLTLRRAEVEGTDYGRVRLWGSIAFILCSIGGGRLLEHVPVPWVIYLLVATSGCLVVACMIAPEAPAASGPSTLGGVWRFASRPRFVLFLLCAACVQVSHAVYYGFATLHWRQAGHSEWLVGLLWAEGVVAEIALFSASRRVGARFSPAALLVLACLAGIVRWSVLGSTTALWALVLVQVLHGLTFGAAHLGAMSFLQRNVPAEHSAAAQGVYSAAVMGAAFGVVMPFAGSLYEGSRGDAFFLGTALAAVGLVLAFALRRGGDGR